jgi:hypothetical protein
VAVSDAIQRDLVKGLAKAGFSFQSASKKPLARTASTIGSPSAGAHELTAELLDPKGKPLDVPHNPTVRKFTVT